MGSEITENFMGKIDSRQIKLGLYFPLLKGWRGGAMNRREHAGNGAILRIEVQKFNIKSPIKLAKSLISIKLVFNRA